MRRLPVMLQSEMAECGLACLAMISSAHGRRIDLGTLRQRFPISMHGASLNRLLHIAGELGLGARVLQVEPEQLRHLEMPAMLHWDLGHFVVLKKAGRRRIVIHDPDSGEVEMSVDACGKHLTGIAVELFPMEHFERLDERRPVRIRHLAPFDSRYLAQLTKLVGLALLSLGLLILQPYYLQLMIDRVLPSLDLHLLNLLTLGFAGLVLLNWIAKVVRNEVSLRLGFALNTSMSERLFGRLLRLPLTYFESRNTSDLIVKFDAVKEIREILTEDASRLLVDGIVVIATSVVLIGYSPLLFAVCFVFTACYLVLRLSTYRRLRLTNEEYFRREVKEKNHFIETVHGMLSIKTQTAEAPRLVAWRNHFRSAAMSAVDLNRQRMGFEFSRDGLLAVEHVIAISIAVRLLIADQLTLGMLFAYLAYKGFFTSSSMSFLEISFKAGMLRVQLDRLADLLHQETEPAREHSAPDRESALVLRAEDLSFRYEDDGPDVLRGVSFELRRGERLAITGPSGCGKTTLIKVILGLLHGYRGSLLFRDLEVREVSRHSLLDGVGAVMQDDRLFAGSVADNIAFFEARPDRERIEEAARLACIHEILVRLPMGYETRIGNLGSVLSAGQLQRLMLARALYRKPEVLVLDEGTANLDAETERRILDQIATQHITVIHAAHRPGVVADASIQLDLGLAPSSGAEDAGLRPAPERELKVGTG